MRTRYVKGGPCLRGHDGLRYASTGQCVECQVERAREYRATETRADRNARMKRYRQNVKARALNGRAVARCDASRLTTTA